MVIFQLAEGLDKHRNDYCIAIWDVNAKPSSESAYLSERQRYSSDLSTTISKPFLELGKIHVYRRRKERNQTNKNVLFELISTSPRLVHSVLF